MQIPNKIEQFRTEFLAACRDSQQETLQLKAALEAAVVRNPSVVQDNIPANYLHQKKILWGPGHFEQCHHGCTEVFSMTRLEHLLCVREELRTTGVKGFKPSRQKIKDEEITMETIFQPGENLKSCFLKAETNLGRARIAMRFELYDMSLNGQYLEEAVKWVATQSSEFFEPYATSAFNKPVSDDRNNWNVKYFDLQTEYLNSNFSKERYLHLIKVRQHLRDNEFEGFALVHKNSGPVESKNQKSTKTVDLNQFPDPSSTDSDTRTGTPNQMPPQTDPSKDSMSAVLRTALMLGGAVAALLALIFSMSR